MSTGYRQRVHPVDMNILPSTLRSRGTVETIQVDELDLATSSTNYRNIDLKKQGRQDSIRNFQTFQEVRYSSMRKKIPGMSSIPKHLSTNPENYSDLQTNYMQDLRQFIRQHFHRNECRSFVPVPNQKVQYIKQLKCHCGSVLMDHAGMLENPQSASPVMEQFIVPKELKRIVTRKKLDEPVPARLPEVKWSPDKITKTVTNSFGKIKFVNVEHVGGTKPAKYIRMSSDDRVEDLFELMIKYWRIMEPQSPNLVISVVGGAKNFKLDGRMRTTFSDGLVKAAKTTSAWLISSGFNMGVMKAVGQAVHQGQSFCWDNNRMAHVLRCIGIAPWGYVRGRHSLKENEEGQGQFCAEYRTSNVILHGQPVPLNADHTHFIFVDDGYRNRYGGVAAMRSKIEQKISQPVSDGGLGIPVVLVVVEGGVDAIADAKSSLEHRIPVVVCEGTGRAADLLAYAYSHTKFSSTGTREMSEKHQMKLCEKIYEAYGKNSWKDEDIDSKTNKIKDSIQICCQNSELMIIFNMNKAEDLDIAILSVLLKAQSGGNEIQRLTQLKLALTWNRVDIAQEDIFREDVLWSQGSLDGVLTEAIVTDKVKFMELILQQGVIMKEYLTVDRLEQLYLQVPRHHYVYKLLFKLTGTTELTSTNVIALLNKILDRYDTDEHLRIDNDLLREEGSEYDPKMITFARPYKHLLIYAVLLHRQSLARFCWEMGDEPVTTAVAVTRLYSAMIRQITRDESILRDMVIQYKSEFENLAVKVLDECQQKDPSKAMMIVERNSPVWNEMTCLQIAAASNDQVFLSAESCMDSISSTWKQGIVSGWKTIMLACLFPPLIPCIIEIAQIGIESLSWYQKIASFYTAPAVKFFHNTLMYLVFVVLHSYMVLVDFQLHQVTTIEILCVVWVFTFMVDYIHTLILIPAPTFLCKFRDFYGAMHYLDWCTVITYFIGFTLHLLGYYRAAKILYCIDTVVFYMGITKAYTAFENLGPKLVMIKKMFGELRLFIVVLMVFLLAYGIAHQGLMYHDRTPSWNILRDVVYYPYWQLYGEIYLEEIESDPNMQCTAKSVDCRTSHWLVPFILAAYLMVGNILLLNLLIAIFSNVFQQVEKNSKEIWKFQMYFLVMEYDKKTFLVPPFSVIPQTLLALTWLFRRTCCHRDTYTQKLGRRHLEYLQLFEKEMMTNYLRRAKANELENLEMTVQKLEKRVDELTKIIEDEVIADHNVDPVRIVMPSDGQPPVWSKGDSFVDFSNGMMYWPTVTDVMSVKDLVEKTDIPAEYYKTQMVKSGSGFTTLPPAKVETNATVSNADKSELESKQEESIKIAESLDNNVKQRENVEDSMKVKGEVGTEKENIELKLKEENVEGADPGNSLSEKEKKKLEKARRKEEKRKRKEEKRARKEKMLKKEDEKKVGIENSIEIRNVNESALNNVNQPFKQEDYADKMRVTFDLDTTMAGPSTVGQTPTRVLVRPPEITTFEPTFEPTFVSTFDRPVEEKQLNIEREEIEAPGYKRAWSLDRRRGNDEMEEERYRKKSSSRRFSGDSPSENEDTMRELRKKVKKKKSKKKRHAEESD